MDEAFLVGAGSSAPAQNSNAEGPPGNFEPLNKTSVLPYYGACSPPTENSTRSTDSLDSWVAARPHLLRAVTINTAFAGISEAATSPLLSRPPLKRSANSYDMLRSQIRSGSSSSSSKSSRPSLLRHATGIVSSALELTAETSRSYKNRPETPTYWTDHAHRHTLVGIWNDVQNTSHHSKYARSTIAHLVSTEKQMLERFLELGEGDVPLTRDRMEYVLGVCMRHPFCTSDKMGRWQVLASGGGARGNWGPF